MHHSGPVRCSLVAIFIHFDHVLSTIEQEMNLRKAFKSKVNLSESLEMY